MVASYLLSLREGLEAALVIGIALSVLHQIQRTELKKSIVYGALSGIFLSFLVALVLNRLGLEFESLGGAIFEGIVFIVAAGFITWMIVWMHSAATSVNQKIEQKVRHAAQSGDGKAMFALVFVAVFREGVELSFFLLAVQQTTSPLAVVSGVLLGLLTAAGLGWVLFSSTRRLNLATFFRVTNGLLIFFAAGMLAVGVAELNEAGIIPVVIEHVWNINPVLNEASPVGMLLKSLLGYNGDPSLTEVAAYLLYLSGIGIYFFKRKPSPAKGLPIIPQSVS